MSTVIYYVGVAVFIVGLVVAFIIRARANQRDFFRQEWLKMSDEQKQSWQQFVDKHNFKHLSFKE